MGGKKVYVGGGEYCYTDNCTKHDRTASAEYMRRAHDCAAQNDAAGYLSFKEKAEEASKKEAAHARIQASKRVVPKPAPAGHKATVTPILEAEERRRRMQQAYAAIKADLATYTPKEELRNGEKIVKFHRDLGLPKYFRKPKGVVGLRYSNHAIEEANNDYYGRIPVLSKINFDDLEVIEVKYSQSTGNVARMLVRSPDGDNNICLVLTPPTGPRQPWRVVTNWYNESTDQHHTLNTSNYNVPNQNMRAAA